MTYGIIIYFKIWNMALSRVEKKQYFPWLWIVILYDKRINNYDPTLPYYQAIWKDLGYDHRIK